ncbi:hypothetical protein VB776_08535 [Arcicella sp. DC2W]|uniref:Uncharacterized protein n=1 Tax=Arcicella gelida TaxID=2984195 RepID=A0ABU5S383_9BACT|nr:hypothetical protein [Arcicella sp. DC2W]MEA5402958.1 hypothetical protein [Arcicella sp. DC2W]
MLTIEEIKQRKAAGKRKWGKSLLLFIKPLFDENIAMDTIVKFLLETYNFVISEDGLYQIKFRYYNAEKNAKKMINPKLVIKNNSKSIHSNIEQNQESETAEKIFSQMKQVNQKTNEFNFGNDF